MNMSVGCHVLRDVVSFPGLPFPYLFNNGAAEMNVLEVPIPVFTEQHTGLSPVPLLIDILGP